MDQKEILRNGITYDNDSLDLAFESFMDSDSLRERMRAKLEERIPLMTKCGAVQIEVGYEKLVPVKVVSVNMSKMMSLLHKDDYIEMIRQEWSDRPAVSERAVAVLTGHGSQCLLDMTGLMLHAVAFNSRCRPLVDEIYEANAEVYAERREASLRYDMDFYAYFGAEEMLCAKRMAGILEYLRTEEGEASNTIYDRVAQILQKGWTDISRGLKQKTEISSQFIDDLIRGPEKGRRQEERCVERMCIVYLLLELLEIRKEASFWVLMDYQELEAAEQYYRQPMTKKEEELRAYRRLRKQMERWMPDMQHLLSVSKSCGQHDVDAPERLRDLFRLGGLDFHALEQTELALDEVEKILCYGRIEKNDFTEYFNDMAVVVLCKYIAHCKDLLEQYAKAEEERQRAKQKESHKKKKIESRKMLEETERHLEYYKGENGRLSGMLMESQRQYESGQKKNLSERERWECERQELIALRNFIYQLQQEEGETEQEPVDKNQDEKAREGLKRASVVVFGGHATWQTKMKQALPGWKFISGEQQTFDLKSMGSYQYLVINTKMFKHRTYYKIMSEKDKGQRIVYVDGNNIKRCMRQLAGQIC